MSFSIICTYIESGQHSPSARIVRTFFRNSYVSPSPQCFDNLTCSFGETVSMLFLNSSSRAAFALFRHLEGYAPRRTKPCILCQHASDGPTTLSVLQHTHTFVQFFRCFKDFTKWFGTDVAFSRISCHSHPRRFLAIAV